MQTSMVIQGNVVATPNETAIIETNNCEGYSSTIDFHGLERHPAQAVLEQAIAPQPKTFMAGSDNVDVVEQAVSLFYSTFKQHANLPREALTIAAAPGRVNLIGEHTDYNDGFVCPLALDKTTVVVGVRAPADSVSITKLTSASFPDQVLEFPADTRGATGQDAAIVGQLPEGRDGRVPQALEPQGASGQVGFATFLESLFEIKGVSAIQKALLCQAAEHEYCNVPCGIMDQFISSCGKKDCALLIDCRTKEPTPVTFQDPDVVIVVCNSNVKHELNGGEYKERVMQCQAAVKTLQTHGHPQMTHLRDATVSELDACVRPWAMRWCEHTELDYLVETARGCEGVFGARMTGGGFGGCIVALVQQQHAQKLMDTLDAGYPVDKFGSMLPKSASFLTMILVCVLTPIPALLVAVLLECLPLRPPSEGWAANWVFWLRLSLTHAMLSFGGSVLLTTFVPDLSFTFWKQIIVTLGVVVGLVGTCILAAHIIGFPVPLMMQFGAIPGGIFTPIMLRLVLGSGVFASGSPVKIHLKRYHRYFLAFMTLIGIYPLFKVLYDFIPVGTEVVKQTEHLLNLEASGAYCRRYQVSSDNIERTPHQAMTRNQNGSKRSVSIVPKLTHVRVSSSSKPPQKSSSQTAHTKGPNWVTNHSEKSKNLVLQGLQLLFHCEYLELVEYVECTTPIVYVVYKSILEQLPNVVYYPGGAGSWNVATAANILVLAMLEIVSLVFLQHFLQRKFGFSAMHQLAFVLETDFYLVQMKLFAGILFLIPFELEHFGTVLFRLLGGMIHYLECL
ncbi:Ribosomal protein S5 domain 2-type fold [Phytophthora cactorum]|nr:Ribosomal protein S5 domain 2-type fold [Phytophthora cactorum]